MLTPIPPDPLLALEGRSGASPATVRTAPGGSLDGLRDKAGQNFTPPWQAVPPVACQC